MSARRLQARLAAETRHRPNSDHSDLRREYRALVLEEHIEKVLAEAPPLTEEQRSRIAALVAPVRGEDLG